MERTEVAEEILRFSLMKMTPIFCLQLNLMFVAAMRAGAAIMANLERKVLVVVEAKGIHGKLVYTWSYTWSTLI